MPYTLAGIDYLVLERGSSIAVDVGASLILAPQSLPVTHQFGLLESLSGVGTGIKDNRVFTVDGHAFSGIIHMNYLRHNHGVAPIAFHRAELVQAIYDGLSRGAKEKILNRHNVFNITSDDAGVKLGSADGSVYEGSIGPQGRCAPQQDAHTDAQACANS